MQVHPFPIIILIYTLKNVIVSAKQSWIDDQREEKQSYQLLSEQKDDQGLKI